MKKKKRKLPGKKRQSLDVVALGDCTIDMFFQVEESQGYCSVDQEKCVVAFAYGEKVPVKSTHRSIAGNCLNVSVGSSRLGLQTALWTMIGSDKAGEEILEGLEKENVRTDFVTKDKKLPTNQHVVISYNADRTILVYHQPYVYPKLVLPKAEWLYFSSVRAGFSKRQPELIKVIDAHGYRLALNPGTFQIQEGVSGLRPFIERCELLFLNVEESALLLEKKPSVPVIEMIDAWHALGVRNVFITDGIVGAYGSDGKQALFVPSYGLERVEVTGAGDAFATGVMSAYHHGLDLASALRWGVVNSGNVVRFVGPIAGLLTVSKMKRAVAQAAKELTIKDLRNV